MTLIDTLRAEARAAPESGIVAVINHGRLREGLIPLWAGEGDLPTPSFISDAAARGLADGETFYTWQKGIPPLRQALARYYARHFGRPSRRKSSSSPHPACMRSSWPSMPSREAATR
jgi:aspartate/methionine/tyrosine aminotransferase